MASTNPPLQSQQCVVSEFQGQVFSICHHLHANFVLQLCISWSVLQQLSKSARCSALRWFRSSSPKP